ncbi:hypothetical protein B0T11DRAFT_143206 [Plectosphaerella cucumerina]|uniref:C2H2-type domain-containing protein n=1 Tax=Plectosphaerella cucumerina TaxID=40658 RepID=A0A8K0WYG3_9PEZI|nr:hypothetical protein B0T11DRAFT_143206 [Plectosphaerella cucumerina]
MIMEALMDSSFNRDGSFDFNTPLLSSTASSPTYDACDPFTPRSGRSTPHGAPLDFGDSFSSTPSFSSHGSPYPFDQVMGMGKLSFQQQQHGKTNEMDMSIDYSMPLTPTRRVAPAFPTVDIDYNTMLQVNLNQHGLQTMSPTHGMADHFTMSQDLQSSPFGMSTPGRSMPASTPGGNHHPMWPCNNDSPIMMFSTNYTPSPSPLRAMNHHRQQSQSPSPTGSRSSADSRRRPMYESVQRRSRALQQQQQQELMYRMHAQANAMGCPPGMENNGTGSTDEEEGDTFVVNNRVGRPRERCCYDGCTKTYQKREHLKRHQRAAHSIGGTPETYQCPAEGCGKSFKDRFDNFKQHLNIHKSGKSARTPYSEAAAALHEELCKQSKTRNTRRNSRNSD